MTPDLIVIGAGSAGCALARRVAESGLRVLLLEAGQSDETYRSRVPAMVAGVVQNPDFDWCYQAEPDPSVGGRADVWPAGKRLGGGSAINGMLFIRGHRHDYDRWAALGAKGWDYESVLPYFKRMESNERGGDDWRGSQGPISVSEVRARYPITDSWLQAAEAAGIPRASDLNGELAEGADYIQLSQRAGQRCSSAAAYLRGLPKLENLEIMLGAQVSAITFDGNRASGVTLRQGGEEKTIAASKGVVVSAGTLNTPRLLMLSGIGPAAELAKHGIALRRDLPGVGANLQEHVGTHIVNEVTGATINTDSSGLRGLGQLLRYVFRREGALTTGIGHAQAFVRTREDLPAPNIQIAFSAFAFDVTPKGNIALRKGSATSTLIGLMRPSHRGRLSLRSADPAAAPVIEHRLLGSDDDIQQLIDGLQIARGIMAAEPMASLVKSEVRPGPALSDREALADYVRMASIPLYHPVGTARMGDPADSGSVIDPDLKVIGMEGLWVADASIMPCLPAANTNAASIMIGEKGADHVLRGAAAR